MSDNKTKNLSIREEITAVLRSALTLCRRRITLSFHAGSLSHLMSTNSSDQEGKIEPFVIKQPLFWQNIGIHEVSPLSL